MDSNARLKPCSFSGMRLSGPLTRLSGRGLRNPFRETYLEERQELLASLGNKNQWPETSGRRGSGLQDVAREILILHDIGQHLLHVGVVDGHVLLLQL